MAVTTEGQFVSVQDESRHAVTFANWWPDVLALNPVVDVGLRDPGSAPLRAALDVIDRALLRPGASDRRRVPSAGAVYPYELLVLVDESSEGPVTPRHVVYATDLSRRRCTRVGPDLSALTRILASDDSDAAFHVVVLTRPWLSMRKYGSRGYVYSQIDAAHAAVNILGISLELGEAELRASLPRAALAGFIDTCLPYREIHSMISVRSAAPDSDAAAWSEIVGADRAGFSSHGDLESYAWSQLPPDLVHCDDGHRPSRETSMLGPQDVGDRATHISPDEWSVLVPQRRSCKRFARGASEGFPMEGLLARLATTLPTDLPEEAAVRVTVVGAALDSAGADTPRTPSGVTVVRSEAVHDAAAVARACMGQPHLANAVAFVLVHAARADYLVDGEPQRLRDVYVRAGALGQLLYLSAAAEGVAVTGIGGFDGTQWARLAALPIDHEILYVLAIGVEENPQLSKWDRFHLAHAHGE